MGNADITQLLSYDEIIEKNLEDFGVYSSKITSYWGGTQATKPPYEI